MSFLGAALLQRLLEGVKLGHTPSRGGIEELAKVDWPNGLLQNFQQVA